MIVHLLCQKITAKVKFWNMTKLIFVCLNDDNDI